MTFADPFAEFNAALGRYSPAFRAQVASHGADGEWRLLAMECRDRVERELCADPVLDYEPKRHQPSSRSQAATSATPVAVSLAPPRRAGGPGTAV
jgi:hypothetical protein